MALYLDRIKYKFWTGTAKAGLMCCLAYSQSPCAEQKYDSEQSTQHDDLKAQFERCFVHCLFQEFLLGDVEGAKLVRSNLLGLIDSGQTADDGRD